MTVFVDPLMFRGWKLHGSEIRSCHLFTDSANLQQLHAIAARIGMRRAWFQDAAAAPHYDLTPARRQAAIEAGAVPVDRRTGAGIWKARRELIARSIERATAEIVEARGPGRARKVAA